MEYNALFAETDRMVIRPVCRGDYDAFVTGYQTCLPPQNRFDEGGFDTSFMTRDWFDALLARRRREAEADFSYMFHLFDRSDGRALGYCDITAYARDDLQFAHVGYTIHNLYWGMGYATECTRALVELGFRQLNFHRLEAYINLDNPASKRVAQKAGFAFECVRKAFVLENGIWTDNEIWFINYDSWKP